MAKARQMRDNLGTAGKITHPSFNHLNLSAFLDVLCGDYRVADGVCLPAITGTMVPNPGTNPPRSIGPGIDEGGPCYDPNGNKPCILGMSFCATKDERQNAGAWEAVAAGTVGFYAALTHRTRPSKLDGYFGDKLIPQDRPVATAGKWFMVSGGPRSGFWDHGLDGWGWDLESPATQWVQWILGAQGRRLGGRYASYQWGQSDWDWGFRSIEALTGRSFAQDFPHWFLTPAEVAVLQEHIETHGEVGSDTITRLTTGHVRKYGIDIIRLRDGQMHCVYSHGTSGPKPPVTWVHHQGDRVRLYMPNDYVSNAQGDGQGRIEVEGDRARIVAWSEDDGHEHHSEWFQRSEVVSHLSMAPRSTQGLRRGSLDPGAGSIPPPGIVAKLKRKRLGPSTFRLTNKSTGSGGAPPDLLYIDAMLEDKPFKPGEQVEVTLDPGTHEARLVAKAGDAVAEDIVPLVVAGEPPGDPEPPPEPDDKRSWWQRFLDWIGNIF
jgi:hypothetical protein